MAFTKGFPSSAERDYKFDKHVIRGREFTYASSLEYEANADRFLGGPLDSDTMECVRVKHDGTIGDKIRYNRRTEEFGVLGNDGIIRSYFRPDPNVHKMPSNLDYFNKTCRAVF